jgi:hypothetical protein
VPVLEQIGLQRSPVGQSASLVHCGGGGGHTWIGRPAGSHTLTVVIGDVAVADGSQIGSQRSPTGQSSSPSHTSGWHRRSGPHVAVGGHTAVVAVGPTHGTAGSGTGVRSGSEHSAPNADTRTHNSPAAHTAADVHSFVARHTALTHSPPAAVAQSSFVAQLTRWVESETCEAQAARVAKQHAIQQARFVIRTSIADLVGTRPTHRKKFAHRVFRSRQ